MGINADANPLRGYSNARILNEIRNDSGLDYQNRIPEATKGNVSKTMDKLLTNRPLMNQFMDGFVNRIGLTIARSDGMWNNPLAQFKMAQFSYGDTIQEYMVGLIKSYVYDPDRESTDRDVWGTNVVPHEVNYHQVNRREKYKFSVNQDLLRQAFLDEGGLSGLIASIMEAPIKSDQWDEFVSMMALVGEYEANGGYFHMRIPEVSAMDSSSDDARAALRRMRALAGTLPFLSTKYNAAHMPVHANPQDMIMLATPEFQSGVDVNALAAAFNQDKMSSPFQTITVPKEYFGVDHCEAILTTRHHFVVADTLTENTSIQNPDNLNWNYWFHHWQIQSISRFTPAVMFSTKFDDEVVTVRKPVTGVEPITILPPAEGEAVPTDIKRGGVVAFDSAATSEAEREGIMWAVKGALSAGTYISPTGVLHAGIDETAESLTVVAISTWIDPANPDKAPFSAEKAIPVAGDPVQWPESHSELHKDGNDDTDGDGAVDSEDAAPTDPKVK